MGGCVKKFYEKYKYIIAIVLMGIAIVLVSVRIYKNNRTTCEIVLDSFKTDEFIFRLGVFCNPDLCIDGKGRVIGILPDKVFEYPMNMNDFICVDIEYGRLLKQIRK